LSVGILVAIEKGLHGVYRQLWSEELINVYEPSHLQNLTYTLSRLGYQQLILDHLTSPVATNLFLQLSIQDRLEFVRSTYIGFGYSQEVSQALSTKFYAPYLLLILMDRDTFMKMTDFTAFDAAIDNSSQLEVD
jgi:hypothetical protein